MKSMSKKALMICVIPTILVAGAVMVYYIITNAPGNRPLVYALEAGVVTFLLLYLLVGRRINAKAAGKEEPKQAASVQSVPAPAAREKVIDPEHVDLREQLREDQIRILLSDLKAASGQMPGEQKAVLEELAWEISSTGIIHKKTLTVCISAVEMCLATLDTFGIAPAGHIAVLDKLKGLAEAA